jgi:hypothetical protein
MSNNLDKYRDEVMTHLKYIKEKVDANHKHLLHLNGRVRSTEVAISWIKGIGTTVTFILGSVLAWFKLGE